MRAGHYHQNVEFGVLQVARHEQPASGKEGELNQTGLNELSMPYSYASEDVGYTVAEQCPCGRDLPSWVRRRQARRRDRHC